MGSIVDVMINSFNGMSPVEQMDNDDDEMMKTNMNMQKSEKRAKRLKLAVGGHCQVVGVVQRQRQVNMNCLLGFCSSTCSTCSAYFSLTKR